MKNNKTAVLTSRKSWFVPYAQQLVYLLKKRNVQTKVFFRYSKIPKDYQIIFILSYFKLIDKKLLARHKHNIVVHESNLPKGRGWAPLFWQILKGRSKIPIVLFEADEGIDQGLIYIKDFIRFAGHELYDEIRKKQALKTIELCLRFLKNYEDLRPRRQRGKATYYKRRLPKDSWLDINKSIKKQFNLLRIANNNEFPAFFYHQGQKYILKINKR